MLKSKDILAAITALSSSENMPLSRLKPRNLPKKITINGIEYDLKFLEEDDIGNDGYNDIIFQLTDSNKVITFFAVCSKSDPYELHYETFWEDLQIVSKQKVINEEWLPVE
jgi:hypothetical protein